MRPKLGFTAPFLACATIAHAATISQVIDYRTSGNSTANVTYNLFDPSLGTLTSATASVNDSLDQKVSVTNASSTDSGPFLLKGTELIQFFFVGPALPSDPAHSYQSNINTQLALSASVANLSAGQTEQIDLLRDGLLPFGSGTAISLFPALVTGTGTGAVGVSEFPIQPDLSGLPSGVSAGDPVNLRSTPTSSSNDVLTLTYSYDPAVTAVPEPASLLLLGAGTLGMTLLRRRRST